ncbi:sugar transferase [Rathayibacter caricis DSM 15933]|jgi:exopolysaccharide biosynthesis polyprenyl glycosylphosphotransferase|uniref:Sugar transferase n=2 Tax=Microbacteriaceae TaxID=85023 RepID=A0A2T4UZB7_9MICO|nr:polyprenyl glycosylphosphotransferase [Rathayibacter sp. Leaf299]PTL74876.1 sugar transferase [Rathayibacter caricis DSM 15933]
MTAQGITPKRGSSWEQEYRGRLLATDVLAILVSVFGTQLFWFDLDLGSGVVGFRTTDAFTINYTVVSVVLSIAWLLALQVFDTRDRRIIGTGYVEYRRIVDSTIWLFGIVAIVAYLLQIQLARGYIITALPAGILLICVGRLVWRSWLTRERKQGRSANQVVLLGSRASVLHTARELRRGTEAGYKLVGAVSTSPGGADALHGETELDGLAVHSFTGIDGVRAVMDATGADTVVVTSSDELAPQRIRELSWTLEPGREHLVVAPSLTDIGGPRIHTRPVAGLPLIHVETPRFDGRQRFAKRLFDIVASTALILLSAPVLIVVAILVRTTSPGPVLFRQERIGLNGATFEMLKFRSMVVDAEARLAALAAQQRAEGNSVLFKMAKDPRVTKVGTVLRRFSLDELPQFLNVFRGDMSLIGPRPPLAREVEQYEAHVHRRFLMKPGITGLWQVSGRSNLSWEDTVRLDLYYVENWSMTGDLIILFKTARAVLARDGAY